MSLDTYFASCSTVAGSLIGLLFVAITLRYDQILGGAASLRNRGMAKGAFVALADALGVSLLALLSPHDLGAPLIVVGLAAATSTVQTQLGLVSLRGLAAPVFLSSVGVYAAQAMIGVALLAGTRHHWLMTSLGYIVLAAFAAALIRCWLLLLPLDETEHI